MPELIPFANLQSGHERIGGASPAAVNVCVDANGVVRRRPVIQAYDEAGDGAVDAGGIDGVYVTSTGATYSTGGSGLTRTLYRSVGGSTAAVGGTPAFVADRRPTFAETEAMVVVAAGTNPHKVLLSTNAASPLGGSPPNASHVVFNSSRLLCNNVDVNRGRVNFSEPASGTSISGHETWTRFVSAEARPDPVVAMGDNANEIFLWGQTNLEVYVPDQLFYFARATARDHGCVAPYSIVRYDNFFAWLDHRRRFVMSDGRTVEDFSQDIGPLLDSFSDVSDCYGYRVSEGMMDAIVFGFPSAGATLAYQPGVGWCRWASASGGQWENFPVTAHAHDPVTDTNVVGLSSGRICKLADGGYQDLGDTVNAFVETGVVSHGTAARKHCKRVRFVLERGRTTGDTEPVAFFQWADAPGQWCAPRAIGLGVGGETHAVVTFDSLGVYRNRQWRFTFSAEHHMALAAAEEDFEILSY